MIPYILSTYANRPVQKREEILRYFDYPPRDIRVAAELIRVPDPSSVFHERFIFRYRRLEEWEPDRDEMGNKIEREDDTDDDDEGGLHEYNNLELSVQEF